MVATRRADAYRLASAEGSVAERLSLAANSLLYVQRPAAAWAENRLLASGHLHTGDAVDPPATALL